MGLKFLLKWLDRLVNIPFLIAKGNEFHRMRATEENARSPDVLLDLNLGVHSNVLLKIITRWGQNRNISWLRYRSANPLRTLKVIKSNLNSIREQTGHQCNSRNSGVTKEHLNKWKKCKIQGQVTTLRMPFTCNRKSINFSSTHVRICVKDATSLSGHMTKSRLTLSKQKNSKLFATYEVNYREGRKKDYYSRQIN